jgi:death-on-curing protein
MKEPVWLNLQAVLILHRESLEEHGGLDGVRDEGLIEFALQRPQNLFHYEDMRNLFHLAAAYAFGLARNHPFNDGNKRTAFISAILFLQLNGRTFHAPQIDATRAMLQLATGDLSEKSFAKWLSENAA